MDATLAHHRRSGPPHSAHHPPPRHRGTATLDLAGIDDRSAADSGVPGHGANLDAALSGRDITTPVVLLAHQPAHIEQAEQAGVDPQLSGHTHGGQLWPFGAIVGLDQPVLSGLRPFGDTQLYVTRGTGYWVRRSASALHPK